jgi:PIN domain nuclease of toxin-antitoxin system
LSETPTDKGAKGEGAMQAFAVEDIVSLPVGAQVFAAFSANNVTLFARKDALAKRGSFSIASGSETTAKGGEEVEGEKSKWDAFGEEAEKHGLTVEQANEMFAKVVELSNSQGINITELAGKLDGAMFEEFDATGAVVLDASRVVDVLGKEMGGDELLKLAKDGQMLKAEKMEDVLTWGVRADGNAFARDTYVELLANASVETLNKMCDQFKAKAKESLAPGRVTQPTETASKKRDVPDSAFKA